MDNFNAQDKQIIEDLKNGVKEFGLTILEEKIIADTFCLYTIFEYTNSHRKSMAIIYISTGNVIEINSIYSKISDDKLSSLYELLNHINSTIGLAYYFIDPVEKAIMLRTAFQITEYFLNMNQLKKALKQHMGTGHVFINEIGELLFTDKTPQSIMEEFHNSKNERLAVLKGAHRESEVRKKSLAHPFTVDGSTEAPVFPTHSHGMTEIGMPEFLMDPLAYGANGNADRIVWSYDYFRKPKNRDKLESIKNGQTVKLVIKDLNPNVTKDSSVYCYRRVYPEFEMVKQAYNFKDPSAADPKSWFVQIYVEGDDFALTDDYYKGGIKW